MQQVADWLEKLGLGQYAQRFAANEITVSILPDLTDADLKELGVLALGHRRLLLRAIAELNKGPTTPVPASPSSTAPPIIAREREAVGERRHVTVMFCDLVGSTDIAARLDAEEWRDLVGAYLDAASGAVAEMGGRVAKKLGDGLMALFGYPVAQENDAERAVRAALSIQRALAELNRNNEGTGKPALVARIAIDSGPVVVDAAGEIFGDVPNVAARSQALAEPGSVVVTARVQRQVAGLFVAEERGSHDLKGFPGLVTLFRIVRASGGGRRAGQRHLTPLIGRDEEMAMLMRRWERARQGDGQLVLIVGEPGLGKSRLIEEFHARLMRAHMCAPLKRGKQLPHRRGMGLTLMLPTPPLRCGSWTRAIGAATTTAGSILLVRARRWASAAESSCGGAGAIRYTPLMGAQLRGFGTAQSAHMAGHCGRH